MIKGEILFISQNQKGFTLNENIDDFFDLVRRKSRENIRGMCVNNDLH